MNTDQLALDFSAARKRRDTGIQRAVAHAGPTWADGAYAFLLEYAGTAAGPFLAENVVAAAAGVVPAPPDGRAWGGVLQRAHRAGVIAKAGYAAAATSNCSPKVLWRADQRSE